MTPAALTEYLHNHIPLTAAMEVRALRCSAGEIEITAPLTANRNHRGTAFGGSLATLGIVSAWALLHLELQREGLAARLVIQKSECDFELPVESDLLAVSLLPPAEWPRFLATLRKRGRARITIETRIRGGESVAVHHRGTYVALT